uniref:Protein TIC 214 n=1 Tax=Solanum lycopersicum TaxID=4081 RepID=A0A3Q7G752_SOLLC
MRRHREKSIGIKQISKKVALWSHKLINELDKQMGEFQDRSPMDHQFRSIKA